MRRSARPEHDALDELATLIADGDWTSLPATFDGIVPLVRPPLARHVHQDAGADGLRAPRGPAAQRRRALRARRAGHREDMVALAALTHPGPFRSHTYRFGTYLGIRVNGVLAAMGGQRMHLPGYREISAICTHPDFRGRGYARAIVARLDDDDLRRRVDSVPPRGGQESRRAGALRHPRLRRARAAAVGRGRARWTSKFEVRSCTPERRSTRDRRGR